MPGAVLRHGLQPRGTMVASVHVETGLVEIRDAETSATLHVIDDFPACSSSNGGLSFSGELLAIGGRDGKPNEKQVRLVSLRGFATLKTLELPSVASRVTFDPAGTRLAVALTHPAGLLIFSAEDGWTTPLRLVPTSPTRRGRLHRLQPRRRAALRRLLPRAPSSCGTWRRRSACAPSSAPARTPARLRIQPGGRRAGDGW